MVGVFTEGSFQIGYTTSGIDLPYHKDFMLIEGQNFLVWWLLSILLIHFYTLPFTPWYCILVVLLRICSVCVAYEKVCTFIRRPQYTVELNILRKYKTFCKVLEILKTVQ